VITQDANIQPKLTIKDSDQLSILSASPPESDKTNPNKLTYEVIITPKLFPNAATTDTVTLTASLDCATPKEKSFSFPYLHRLGDDIELSRATQTIQGFNFKSKTELDDFLKKYPDSARAPLIFALRMKLLREGAQDAKTEEELLAAINEYNEFIAKYPDSTGAQVATHEVFRQYERHDSIAAYTEFLKRYPFSLEAALAEEHITRKVFDATMAQTDITAYDSFIETFPEAEPYVSKVIERAQELASAEVKGFIGTLKDKPSLDQRFEIQDYASEKFKEWDELTKQPIALATARLIQAKLNRLEHVISTDLTNTPSYQNLILTKRIDDIKKHLTQIEENIKRNHTETLTALSQGFQKLHEHIDTRFNALNTTLNKIEERLQRQEAATAALDARLNDLNSLINAHYTELKKQSGDIQKSSALDTALSAVTVGLDLYNAWSSPYKGGAPESKTYNLNFSPDIVVNSHKSPSGRFSKVSNFVKGLCPTISGALVTATMVAGPLSVGVGFLGNATCKWGISWLSKKLSR
jgi:hypothetical protein